MKSVITISFLQVAHLRAELRNMVPQSSSSSRLEPLPAADATPSGALADTQQASGSDGGNRSTPIDGPSDRTASANVGQLAHQMLSNQQTRSELDPSAGCEFVCLTA